MSCPVVAREFKRGVNMRPEQIRAWAKSPESRRASYESTRRRLPALATLRAKSPATWTPADCAFAARVNAFNQRMGGMVQKWGPTPKACIALANWGRIAPGCRPQLGVRTRRSSV